MFRILQESLTNAHRHAKTDRVRVSLEVGQHTVALNVRDFGCGIPAERLRLFQERNEGRGVGLGGMRERARELGGLLSVAPAEDNVAQLFPWRYPLLPGNRKTRIPANLFAHKALLRWPRALAPRLPVWLAGGRNCNLPRRSATRIRNQGNDWPCDRARSRAADIAADLYLVLR